MIIRSVWILLVNWRHLSPTLSIVCLMNLIDCLFSNRMMFINTNIALTISWPLADWLLHIRLCGSVNCRLLKMLVDTCILFWGHWYPCFGLLSTSMCSPGFNARVDSLIHTWQRHMWCMFPEIKLWCDTHWPLGSQHGNWAVLIHILLNKHWRDK